VADIIALKGRKRSTKQNNSSIIRKFIDGEFVEYVDFDMLSLSQQAQLLDSNSNRE
jgi:hypothetical protein